MLLPYQEMQRKSSQKFSEVSDASQFCQDAGYARRTGVPYLKRFLGVTIGINAIRSRKHGGGDVVLAIDGELRECSCSVHSALWCATASVTEASIASFIVLAVRTGSTS